MFAFVLVSYVYAPVCPVQSFDGCFVTLQVLQSRLCCRMLPCIVNVTQPKVPALESCAPLHRSADITATRSPSLWRTDPRFPKVYVVYACSHLMPSRVTLFVELRSENHTLSRLSLTRAPRDG